MKNVSPREIAQALEWAWVGHAISLADVIRWADSTIASEDRPPKWAINLSSAFQDKNQALHCLHQVPGDFFKPEEDIFPERRAFPRIEAQLYRRLHLIDILSPGTGRADKMLLNLILMKGYAIRDFNHLLLPNKKTPEITVLYNEIRGFLEYYSLRL